MTRRPADPTIKDAPPSENPPPLAGVCHDYKYAPHLSEGCIVSPAPSVDDREHLADVTSISNQTSVTVTPDLPVNNRRRYHNCSANNVTVDQSWLQRCGGPDDSTATEVMTLKKLLEEERDTVKREKEAYALAALRLNREVSAEDVTFVVHTKFEVTIASHVEKFIQCNMTFCYYGILIYILDI